MKDFKDIVSHFATEGTIDTVKPLGNGLINDTYIVRTAEPTATMCCSASTITSSPTWRPFSATSRL